MNVNTIWRLGKKELWCVARDPMLLAFIAFAFTVSLYTGAAAMPENLNRAAIAIVDEDRSPLSERLISAFYLPFFLPPEPITLSEMDARMDAGLDTFSLVIPARFQRDVLAGHSPALQLNVDATRVSQAFVGSGYVQAIALGEVQTFVKRSRGDQAPPIDLAVRNRFNPELKPSWFGGLMELVDHVTMLAIVLTGAAWIRERERGTIEHLLVMPVTPLEILASKVWSMGLVVLSACAFGLTVVVQGMLGVPIEGSLGLYFALTVLHLFCATALGFLLASFARSMPQFGLLLILVLLPLQMLSGGVTPRESMPVWLQVAMLAAPTTHYVMLSQGILFRGAGLAIVWPQMVALVVIGAALFGVTLLRFRRAMATMS